MQKTITPWVRAPRISKGIYALLVILVLSIPFLSNYSLVTFYLHKSLAQFIPVLSDEIYYWHEVATFRAENFSGGYYTVNEQPAAAAFTHFYTHGPVYPVLFGTLTKAIGWQFNYPPILNFIVITLAVGWFVWVTKPSPLQLVLIGLVLLTNWSNQLYMTTNMLVVIFNACGVVSAAFFFKLVSESETASNGYWISFFLFIVLLATAQVSWALLFIPYMVLVRKKLHLSLPLALAAAAVLIGIGFLVSSQISAPYPNFPNQLLAALKGSFHQGLRLFVFHAKNGLRNLFDITQDPLWLMLRGEMLLLIFASAGLLWIHRRDRAAVHENLIVLTSCGLLLIEIILLYDLFSWRDFRLFAPIVLMGTLLLIARNRIPVVVVVLIMNLALGISFLKTYQTSMTAEFPETRTAIDHFAEELAPIVKYEDSRNAWDNTILIPRSFVDNNLLLGVPAGIGISWFDGTDSLPVIKSRYLLLDQDSYDALKDRACLGLKRVTDLGSLYVNQGNDCKK